MAIIGRISARQRLRKATEQSLLFPTFNAAANCREQVLGGLWPSELDVPRVRHNPEVATLAHYLKRDLQRIADSAEQKLEALNKRGLPDTVREAEESRVINKARAFAVRRVDSTVRQLPQQRPSRRAPSVDLRPARRTATAR